MQKSTKNRRSPSGSKPAPRAANAPSRALQVTKCPECKKMKPFVINKQCSDCYRASIRIPRKRCSLCHAMKSDVIAGSCARCYEMSLFEPVYKGVQVLPATRRKDALHESSVQNKGASESRPAPRKPRASLQEKREAGSPGVRGKGVPVSRGRVPVLAPSIDPGELESYSANAKFPQITLEVAAYKGAGAFLLGFYGKQELEKGGADAETLQQYQNDRFRTDHNDPKSILKVMGKYLTLK